MPTQPDGDSVTTAGKALEIENYVETYKVIAEWIRFADAKAGVTLTVNGILLGLLVPTLKAYIADTAPRPFEWWTTLVVVLFIGWLLFMAASAAMAFLCVLPIRGTHRQLALHHTRHFHPAAICQHFGLTDVERFIQDCNGMSAEAVKKEIQCAMLIDAHLSASKYGYVARAIKFLGGSIVFGFLYLLAVQF